MITEDQLVVGGTFWYIDITGTLTIPVTITSLPATNMVGLAEHLPDGGTRDFYTDIGTFLSVATIRTAVTPPPTTKTDFGGIVAVVVVAAFIYYLLTRR